MIALQDKILADLPKDKQHYIVRKTEDAFAKFTSGPYHAIGYLAHGQLVAQALVAFVHPDDKARHLTESPEAMQIIKSRKPYGVLEGILVCPEHRQQQLMKNMVNSGIGLLRIKNHTLPVYSEVAQGNEASRKGFERNKFQIIASGEDPDDGCKLWYMQHQPGLAPKVI